MKCLVVDDDPLVCEMVESWLSGFDGVEYCLKANDGMTALNLVSTGEIDLLFLDLQIPDLDGESLLRSLPKMLPVIVVSASESFGAKSYDYGVLDYLVKPLEKARFYKAVQRAKELRAQRSAVPASAVAEEQNVIFVRDGSQLVRIGLDSLLYIKAEANYVSFVSQKQQVMSLMSMKRVEELLSSNFVRVHRSWIVNWRKIDRVDSGQVVIGDKKIPIGENYRETLTAKLNAVN
jgi:two-component system, LytTR family, response regulator